MKNGNQIFCCSCVHSTKQSIVNKKIMRKNSRSHEKHDLVGWHMWKLWCVRACARASMCVCVVDVQSHYQFLHCKWVMTPLISFELRIHMILQQIAVNSWTTKTISFIFALERLLFLFFFKVLFFLALLLLLLLCVRLFFFCSFHNEFPTPKKWL